MDFAEGIHKLHSKKEHRILQVLKIACSLSNTPNIKLSQGIHTGFYFKVYATRYMLIYDVETQKWVFQEHYNTYPVYPTGLVMSYVSNSRQYKASDIWYMNYLNSEFELAKEAIPIYEDNIIKGYSYQNSTISSFTSDYINLKQYPLNNWNKIPQVGQRGNDEFYIWTYKIGRAGEAQAKGVLLKWSNNAIKLGLLYYDENKTIVGNPDAINSIRSEYNTIMDEISHIIKKGMLIPYESDNINEYLLNRDEAYDLEMYERGLSLFVQLLNNIGINIAQRELDETIRYTNTLSKYEEKSRLEVLHDVFRMYNEQLHMPLYSLFRFVDYQRTLHKNEKAFLYRMDQSILTYLAFLYYTYSKKK